MSDLSRMLFFSRFGYKRAFMKWDMYRQRIEDKALLRIGKVNYIYKVGVDAKYFLKRNGADIFVKRTGEAMDRVENDDKDYLSVDEFINELEKW